MPKKKLFEVVVPVTRASGEQIFRVEAETAEQAKALVEAGDLDCYEEHLAVETVADQEEWEVADITKYKS